MAKNLINVTRVMNEYAEELASILVEKRPVTIPMAIDPLWNTWHESAWAYPSCVKCDDETESDDKAAADMPRTRKNYSNRGTRRDRTEKHKAKLKRNAEVMERSYYKRLLEDMDNSSFSKKRGGRRVEMPKSRSMQADVILKRAEKMRLISLDGNENEEMSTGGHWVATKPGEIHELLIQAQEKIS